MKNSKKKKEKKNERTKGRKKSKNLYNSRIILSHKFNLSADTTVE